MKHSTCRLVIKITKDCNWSCIKLMMMKNSALIFFLRDAVLYKYKNYNMVHEKPSNASTGEIMTIRRLRENINDIIKYIVGPIIGACEGLCDSNLTDVRFESYKRKLNDNMIPSKLTRVLPI